MEKNRLKLIRDYMLSNPIRRLFEPNKDNHPNVIYKYRNWSDDYHKDVLRKNQLFMSSPSGLNDPFDTRIFENYPKFLNDSKSKEEFVSKSIERNKIYFNEKGISVKDARLILEDRLSNQLKFQVRAEYLGSRTDDEWLGITCFSEKWNSIVMWSHYSENHTGVCIGFDEKYLRYSQLFGKMKRVTYSEEYPELNPLNKSVKSDELKYFYKSKDWQYECEIRALNIYEDGVKSVGDRIVQLDDKYIKEVVIGLNTSKTDEEEIIGIARNKGIAIWKCYKSDFKFGIERKKII